MYCPNCGNQNAEGGRFCASCGADLSGGTQPIEGASDHPQVTQAQPSTLPQGAPQLPTPAEGGSGLAILVSVFAGLALVVLAVGGYFAYQELYGDGDSSESVTSDTGVLAEPNGAEETGQDGGADPVEPLGFPTAQEAVAAELPADWVSDIQVEDGRYMEYVVGPPASEYVDVLVVEQQADSSWLVTDSYAFEFEDPIDGGDVAASDEAEWVVDGFLAAVMEDRADDAQALTVAPFSEDPASSSFSNGDFKSYDILSVEEREDGTTFWVRVSETWTYGTDEWIYVCVPTDVGYRISELRLP